MNSNALNPMRFALHHLYILQLEEYNLKRYFLYLLKSKGVPLEKPRKNIVWTQKAKVLFVTALVLQALTTYFAISVFQLPFVVLFLFFFLFMYVQFIFLSLAVLLLWPVDFFLKQKMVARAKTKLTGYPQLIIIGIAGSYGKTTMKEAVYTVLSQKYSVLKTPENINTPLGIARLIEKDLSEKTQFLIVEMGEYQPGDIKEICSLVKPDIGIITGINEAHFERMGSLEKAVATVFELAEWMKPDGTLYLNGDDSEVLREYSLYQKKHPVLIYSMHSNKEKSAEIKNIHYLEEGRGIKFDLLTPTRSYKLTTKLLGTYSLGTIMAAVMIGENYNITKDQITSAIKGLKPNPHRLQPIEGTNNILVIDDSYNGNPTGVDAAIEVLSRFTNRRKLYITPGLVETGPKNEEIHYNIGKKLGRVANKVILIKNTATPALARGLHDSGFSNENIVWFNTAKEAHIGLASITKANDVILFQNDWPDNYL